MSALADRLSFSSGELARPLWHRRDLARHQTGVKRAENMIVSVEGGLFRRSGTRFVRPLKDEARPARLIPFRLSDTDAYMLVLNAGFMRVFQNGGVVESSPGVPYELAYSYADGDLDKIRVAQSADTLFIACKGYFPATLKRNSHTSWTFGVYTPKTGATELQNTNLASTVQASASLGITNMFASQPIFNAGHVFSLWRLDEADLSTVALWVANEAITAGQKRRYRGNVYVAANNANSGTNPPVHEEGSVLSGAANVNWAFQHPGYAYVVIQSYVSPTQVTIEPLSYIPDSCVATPTSRWYEAAWSIGRGFPEEVSITDQRLVWGRGDILWLTKPGDFYEFEITATDATGLVVRLVPPDGTLAKIRWILVSGIIVVGCQDGEWLVRGPSPFDPLTMANIRPSLDRSEGSPFHRPMLVDGGCLFYSGNGQRLIFAQFDGVSERLNIRDTTRVSRHVLGTGGAQLAYQRDPNRLVWVLSTDGTLKTMTFWLDEEVVGWTRHPLTNGKVLSIASIPNAATAEDELWLVVERTVNGAVHRYIEVLKPAFKPASEDAATADGAWFADCGLEYVNPNPAVGVSTISGLAHLEGQSVAIHVDGADHARKVVAGGIITLDRPCHHRVVAGLPIAWKVKGLPIDLDTRAGSTRGDLKQARHVVVDVVHAALGHLSVNGGEPEPLLPTGQLGPMLPVPLTTGPLFVTNFSPHAETVEWEIFGDSTLPFHLTGASLAVDTGRFR